MKRILSFVMLVAFCFVGFGSLQAKKGGPDYTWKPQYVNCYDEGSQTWDIYQECCDTDGGCTDQYDAPCK